ncbi:lysine 2,3-aminomutase [Paramaledivibacter caminithermalis DSM 15212]|uniref:Lysine 2,3-aminomutase n=2 Tax=Paramaledivibacter TaxID=1884934 RepID=A0A1M6PQX4_PARC5|nr:lysine 2,3-aminomutase [Paramaledivibacter caminithermalis DSM 15212]
MVSRKKINELFNSNPYILRLLVTSDNINDARTNMFNYLNKCEKEILSANCLLHTLEKKNVRDCINVFKNIISEDSEKKTKCSCLKILWKLATENLDESDWEEISDAFLEEMIHLFKGIIGLSGIYSRSGICKNEVPAFVNMVGRDAAIARSSYLDKKTNQYLEFIKKNQYKTGLAPDVIERRRQNKKAILEMLGGTEEDWLNYRWHLKMVLRKVEDIEKIIELSSYEKSCIETAIDNKVPFGITPYYLSLMDKKKDKLNHDRCLRTHVIPNKTYLDKILKNGIEHMELLDYMHESDTSPENLITRRYPMIAIVKPYSWCPQICVYCQRNWELKNDNSIDAAFSSKDLGKAIDWFRNNSRVKEVLITGGDPLILNNEQIEYILKAFSEIEHIKRIRIGTRTLVTMPMRFDDELLSILEKYHKISVRTISIMTHVQNAYEITEEMANVIKKIRMLGIDVYNQQVFTMQNCRRFETSFLRENLKAIGVSPYYLFNLKGKEETSDFKVPVARLLQEQKEEARIMPGIVRTDKAVFNIPTLGKNYLSSWQDHDIIMILKDGSRVYEFYPWEKYMTPVNTYLYTDEPIYNFLNKLKALGENPEDYKTIWYYF